MQKINSKIIVLLASGYSIDGEAREILEEGIAGFIQKPYTIQKLSQMLQYSKQGNPNQFLAQVEIRSIEPNLL